VTAPTWEALAGLVPCRVPALDGAGCGVCEACRAAARPPGGERLALDQEEVVLSVRPPYADRLIHRAGRKRWEFRRQALPPAVRWAVIYRSGGDPARRGVVGVVELDPARHREWTARQVADTAAVHGLGEHDVYDPAGISPAKLAVYAEGWDAPVWGLAVARVVRRYDPVVPLAAFGLGRAPVSWRYALPGWREVQVP